MFRRGLKGIFNNKDTDQAEGAEASNTQQDGQQPKQVPEEAEGFLCPICMIRFESPEHLTKHFDAEHSEPAAAKPIPHFTCPVCKMSFSTSDALQSHYKQKHETTRNGSFSEDGGRLLYSKQVSSNSTALIAELDEEQAELDMSLLQLKASEESRMLLSSELHQSQKELSQAEKAFKTLKTEKETVEQKAGRMAADIVDVKARADEVLSQKVALEDHIQTLKQQLSEKTNQVQKLESQLGQRPGGDDIVVLQQELANSQTLMDVILQERDKEKEHLEKELGDIKEKHRLVKQKVRDLEGQAATAPLEDEISSLQVHVTTLEKDAALKERDDSIARLSQSLVDMERQVTAYQAQITQFEATVASVTKQSTEKDELLISERAKNDKEKQELLKERDDKIEELQQSLKQAQASVREKESSIAVVEARERESEKGLVEKQAVVDESARELAASREQLAELRTKVHGMEEELNATRDEWTTKCKLLESECAEKQSTLDKHQQNIQDLTGVSANQTSEMSELRARVEESKLTIASRDEALVERNKTIEKLTGDLEKKESEVKLLAESVEKLERESTQVTQALQESAYSKQVETSALQAQLDKAEVATGELEGAKTDLQQQLTDKDQQHETLTANDQN